MNHTKGECAKALLQPEGLKKLGVVLFEAAQQRQLSRVEGLCQEFGQLSLAQQEFLLYSRLMRTLGYPKQGNDFEKLAEALPYAKLQKELIQPQGKIWLLGQWLGIFGWQKEAASWTGEFADWGHALAEVQLLGNPPLRPMAVAPGRPHNHPLRRLVGFAHHLQQTAERGLLKSWLAFLWEMETILQGKNAKARVLEHLQALFQVVEPELLQSYLLPSSAKRLEKPQQLIGQDRQLVMLINGVIPFFLAWARHHQDRRLERILFGLFLVLPPEGENSKIKLMREKLCGEQPLPFKKTLSLYQGLIQIYEDHCAPQNQDCRGCVLPRLLGLA